MKNIRHAVIATAAVLALAAGAAACGGGSAGRSSTAQAGRLDAGDRAFLAFTACMRRHGIHMSDPYHRTGHSGLTLDFPTKTPPVVRALGRCEHIIASIVAMKDAGAAAQQNGMTYAQRRAHQLGLLHYARCMRSHGIPMLDPDANGNLNLGNVPGIASVGRYTPPFLRADRACRSLLPAGVADNGSGP